MSKTTLWTEQLRPEHIHEIVGQNSLKMFLQGIVDAHSINPAAIDNVPHLIIHGPPGTGKTSLARAFAVDLYPLAPVATLYLNASDDRTISTVRDRICVFLSAQWIGVTRQIIIFDEVETMTEPAQLTLRSLMDTPLIPGTPLPLFIFLCNTLTRIVPLIRSRALALFCGHLSHDDIGSMLARVGRDVPTTLACAIHRGDMRAFLHRAQQGEDSNKWIEWFARLRASLPGRSMAVWEDGTARAPLWIVLRHVIVLCRELNLYMYNTPAWETFLKVAIGFREHILIDSVVDAWELFVSTTRSGGSSSSSTN